MASVIDKYVFALFLDASNFAKNTNLAEKAVGSLRSTILKTYTTIGGIDLFKNMLSSYTDTARSVGRLSEVTGENIKTLQAWQYAMSASGGEVSSMNSALIAFSEEMGQIKNYGTSSHLALFQRLGIDVYNANGKLKTATNLLYDTAKVFSQLDNLRAFDFGRSLGLNDDMIILLRRYGENLETVIKSSEKFAVIKQRDIMLTRQYDAMLAELRIMFLQLASAIGPEFIKWFRDTGMKEIQQVFGYFVAHQAEIAQGFRNILNAISDFLPSAQILLDILNGIIKSIQWVGTAAGTVVGSLSSRGTSNRPKQAMQSITPALKATGFFNNPLSPRNVPSIFVDNIDIITQATNGEGIKRELNNIPKRRELAPNLAGALI